MKFSYIEKENDWLIAYKEIMKTRRIMDIIVTIYILIFMGIFFFYYKIIEYGLIFTLMLIVYFIIITIKKNKNKKLSKRRYEELYGEEVLRSFEFQKDMVVCVSGKLENTYQLKYESIKKVLVKQQTIFIISIYKEWIYIPKNKISENELKEIIHFLKGKNIKIK